MTSTPPSQWLADVVRYAAQYGLADYLEPLRQLTLRHFPTAVSFRAYLEDDPEVDDLTFLVVETTVPERDVPDWLGMRRAWSREFFGTIPRPRQCPFVLKLRTV